MHDGDKWNDLAFIPWPMMKCLSKIPTVTVETLNEDITELLKLSTGILGV
jgi:hypothetical protein